MSDPSAVPDAASDLPGEIADLLGAATRRFRAMAKRDLDPRGVTFAQVRALRACVRDGEPIRMSELAQSLGIVRRSATSVVDELEVRGLVVRRGEVTDRRAVSVVVTAKGHRLLDDLQARRRSTAGELSSGLSGREQRALRDLLRKIAGHSPDPDPEPADD